MSTTSAIPALHNSFGCLSIASALTMSLWGAGSVQVYYYFDRYTNDSLYMKFQVFSIWAIDTAHQALIIGSTYRYLVTHYADVTQLAKLDLMLRDTIILTAVICVLVQSIFVDRIYCLSKKNLILTGLTGVLSLAQFVSTIVYYAKCYSFTTFAQLDSERTLMRIDHIITAFADVAIASALVYLFFSNRTGFRKNDTVAAKIVALTLNTGALTAVCAVVCLITSFSSGDTFVYLLFYLMLSRLYMNSVMSSLNSRSRSQSQGSNGENSSIPRFNLNDMRNNRPELSANHVRPNGTRVVTIKVDTETILDNGMHDGLGLSDSDMDRDSPYQRSKPIAY